MLGAQVYFVKSPLHFVPEQPRDCVSPWRAYRIPFLWSKAGIIEAGCSDMRATTNCNTSCRFSSCRGTREKTMRQRKSKPEPLRRKNKLFVLSKSLLVQLQQRHYVWVWPLSQLLFQIHLFHCSADTGEAGGTALIKMIHLPRLVSLSAGKINFSQTRNS